MYSCYMAFDLTISDPLGFIADLKKNTKLFGWVSLIFQLLMSGTVTFLFTTGTALVAHQPTPVAIGEGMIMCAVSLVGVFTLSPLTRGMILVRPEDEAEAELKAKMAVTEKGTK